MRTDSELSRRGLLKLGVLAGTALLLPCKVMAKALPVSARDSLDGEHMLSFYNTHTGEKFRDVFFAGGKYIPEALDRINYILRDYRTGIVKPIDPKLLGLLFALARKVDANKPFHIISGYRSPKTNALLRKKSTGVASRSLHMNGKAIDIRVPGIDLAVLRKAALSLKGGGVGYYARSNFIHVDTGKIRRW